MKRCLMCGYKNEDSENKCLNCGQDLLSESSVEKHINWKNEESRYFTGENDLKKRVDNLEVKVIGLWFIVGLILIWIILSELVF